MPKFEQFPAATQPEEKKKRPLKPSRGGFGKALALAAALHAPLLSKDVSERIFGAEVIDAKKEALWKDPDAVLRPQKEGDREVVELRKAERLSRVNPEAVAKFKKNFREKIERGEEISMKEAYLTLEKLNGVPSEHVLKAQGSAEALIARFRSMIGSELDENEIRQIVTDMYGDDDNYEWGQGSVTEYFRTGKRNCGAIAEAQLIVFEEIVRMLPEHEQKKFQLGKRIVKQHEIATLHVNDQHGRRTYLLEPTVIGEPDGSDTTGTANLPLNELKSALVSERPIRVSADKAQDPRHAVQPSPDLDVVVDQPVYDGLIVDGPLKASSYVEARMREERVRPMSRNEYNQRYGVVEIEYITPDPGPDVAFAHYERALKEAKDIGQAEINATYFLKPSKKTILALDGLHKDLMLQVAYSRPKIDLVKFGDISEWSTDALKAAMSMRAARVDIQKLDITIQKAKIIAQGQIPYLRIQEFTRPNGDADAYKEVAFLIALDTLQEGKQKVYLPVDVFLDIAFERIPVGDYQDSFILRGDFNVDGNLRLDVDAMSKDDLAVLLDSRIFNKNPRLKKIIELAQYYLDFNDDPAASSATPPNDY